MGWLTKQTPKTPTVESPAFPMEAAIPRNHPCDGEDLSPPLKIGNIEEGTKSLALIMDDPDAPAKTWVHWASWNLPAGHTNLDEGVDVASPGAVERRNDFDNVGYGGPCHLRGMTHRHHIRVYAPDGTGDLERAASVEDLKKAVEPRVLALGLLFGTYTRR